MKTFIVRAVAAAIGLGFIGGAVSCRESPSKASSEPAKGAAPMNIARAPFGTLPDGTVVEIFTLVNAHGLKARLMTYGATLVSLELPDRNGGLADCVLGHETLDGYLKSSPYFGSIVGRYGNRIARGRFALDGKTYTLAANDGANHLHGGVKGFDKVVWAAAPVREPGVAGVQFSYLSKDGEEGYPGALDATVIYTLTDDDELIISYEASTDKPTVVNLTHHSYFNLAGGTRDILDHELTLFADRFTPVDDGLIPTGVLGPVAGTVMGFLEPMPIGARIGRVPGGYDHNYVLNGEAGTLRPAARVYEPGSGRVMDISTVEPGIQFYSGNFLDGTIAGKGGRVYGKHWGFCLETQHFPDSPNHPDFPSTVLRPGDVYATRTIHKFSTR